MIINFKYRYIYFCTALINRAASRSKYRIHFFLCKPAETVGLHAVQPIEILQDQAQRILVDYTRSRYPQQPGRIGRLMILVGYLRCVSSKTVERLFFHETIGEIPISRLLVDMYQMEKYINWNAFSHTPYYTRRRYVRTTQLAAFQNSSDSLTAE